MSTDYVSSRNGIAQGLDISPKLNNYQNSVSSLNAKTYPSASFSSSSSSSSSETPVLVKDFSQIGYFSDPTNVNGTLFFEVDGTQLWKTNGTTSGTVEVFDFNPAKVSSLPTFLTNLTNVNGTLYFDGYDYTHGVELWKSDGTTAGTVLVKDINLGDLNSSPTNLTNINGTLFFGAKDGNNQGFYELWKSDGTAAGTVQLALGDNNPYNNPRSFTNVNGTLFFVSSDNLWKSDGTASGTVPITTYNYNPNFIPLSLTSLNGTLFFSYLNYSTLDYELWESDGTASGTVVVKPGNYNLTDLTNVNGTLFFAATDSTNGTELWKSDGTAAGTVLFKDINPGADNSNPANLTNINGTLFFTATVGGLWHGAVENRWHRCWHRSSQRHRPRA